MIDIYEFFEEHAKAKEKELQENKIFTWSCPSCGAYTFNVSAENCELCNHHESIVICESCKRKFFEIGTECFSGSDEDAGDWSHILCHDCIESERESSMADMYDNR